MVAFDIQGGAQVIVQDNARIMRTDRGDKRADAVLVGERIAHLNGAPMVVVVAVTVS